MPTLKRQRGHPVTPHEQAQEMARDPLNIGFSLDEVDDQDNYDTKEQDDTSTTQA